MRKAGVIGSRKTYFDLGAAEVDSDFEHGLDSGVAMEVGGDAPIVVDPRPVPRIGHAGLGEAA
ncbi:hypothetical protein WQQ_06460 [Hydrocarboniphaga effusa AP103]|uniref:Uncharacterized protein n=1 Tax=Hydrocarboniphaga effusa AP103 TaxID=1172194 RepID=I7ZF50_9GAMM|nr:hypothetical protein WQQ_06460 [Hydrocarboniphaga effusa AP103]